MFRFALVVLAAIGLGSLLFGGVGWGATGVGLLLLAPLVIVMKIAFLFLAFGLFRSVWAGRRGHSSYGPWGWRPRRSTPSRQAEQGPSERERFEEWHRLQHAREEVDSWVDPEP